MFERHQIAFRVVLTLAEGPALEREWTWGDIADGTYPEWPFSRPPLWLEDPTVFWRHPLDPHEFVAHVPPGSEERARRLLAS